ncbi:DNA-binding MarR family transcriptional regulator [Micromonospora pisi]|uniref:DNA-binding MarR family transcriptional regulator n=1 Tax=Micromonospora pisi TaxID=589240 RepID=A0A495JSL6_9ACTN|nr:MarR family transcriptional regulator [Micromonospora pisi]RKR91963.1 DNA-binding MarR family transcriptional regulator [Micromonospora pisi]
MRDDEATGTAARRRMTTRELATWRALIDTTDDLRKLMGAQLARESNLSPADYQVLLALSETEGTRLRSSELAASIDWERSRLSHHLGRMERRGLIRRDECATDNRGSEISLTDDGARIFRAATAPHLRAIKQHFGDALTPEQFDALADILRALREHLQPQPVTTHTGKEEA